MSLTLLPARADMIDEVARRVEACADPSRATVVFPGKRPAHFLRQRLARARGAGFIPPRIASMDELVDLLFEARGAREGTVRPRAEPIDAVAILYEIQTAADAPLGGSAFMTLDAFFPLGLRIQGDLEDLLIAGVTPAQVAGVQPLVEEEVPLAARRRLRALSEFYEKFYPELERRSLSSRSSRYVSVSRTLERTDIPGEGPFIVAGFYALTPAERAILRRAAAWRDTQMLFQDGPGIRERIREALPDPRIEEAAPAPSDRPPERPRLTFTPSTPSSTARRTTRWWCCPPRRRCFPCCATACPASTRTATTFRSRTRLIARRCTVFSTRSWKSWAAWTAPACTCRPTWGSSSTRT